MIRVTSYEYTERDTGRGGKETISHSYHTWFDTHEVEMIKTPMQGSALYTVHMKSGKTFDVGDEDYSRIEAAMIAREEREAE